MTGRPPADHGNRSILDKVLHAAGQELVTSYSGGLLLTTSTVFGGDFLLSRILASADPFYTVRVHGSESFSGVPCAALAPLLEDSPNVDTESEIDVLIAVRDRVHRLGAGRSCVVVVRGPEHLDPSSIAVLTRLAESPSVGLLIRSGPRSRLPLDLELSLADGFIEEVLIPVLTPEDVRQYFADFLGGGLPVLSSSLVCEVLGGSPVLMEMVTRDDGLAGLLHLRDGVWILPRELILTDRVAERVFSLMSDYAPRESDVLATVALAHQVPLSMVVDLWGVEPVNALLLEGALRRVEDAGQTCLRVAPPMLSAAIRQQIDSFRSRRLWDYVEEHLEALSNTPAAINRVLWKLSVGVRANHREILTAATLANRLDQPGTAERLLRLLPMDASDDGDGDDDDGDDDGGDIAAAAQVQRARSEFYNGRTDLALSRIRKVLVAEAPHPVLTSVVHLAVEINLSTGMGASTVDHAIRRRAGVPDDTGGDYEQSLTIRLYRDLQQLAAGSLPVEPVTADGEPPQDLREAVIWHLCAGELLFRQGNLEGAAGELTRSLGLVLDHERLRNYGGYVLVRLMLVLAGGGFWEELQSLQSRLTDGTVPWLTRFIGLWELVVGIAALRRGRPTTALDHFRVAVIVLRDRDIKRLRPLANALAAHTGWLVGDDGAMGYVREFSRLAHSGAPELRALADGHVAAVGEPAVAHRRVGQLVQDNVALLNPQVSAELIFLGVQSGDSSDLGEGVRLTAGLEDPRSRCLNSVMAAVRSGVPERLIEAGEFCLQHGQELLVPVCLGSLLLESAGSSGRLVRSGSRLLAQLDPELQQVHPQLATLRQATRLTPRETSVAAEVASGKTARQIAEDYGVSVRTVDGHVESILTKLGLASRRDITKRDQ